MLEASVIGLGTMGSTLAQLLLQKGYYVTVWNRTIAIYVDPDFASADRDRIQIFQGKQTSSDVTRNVVKQYFDYIQSGAEPEAIAALFNENVG